MAAKNRIDIFPLTNTLCIDSSFFGIRFIFLTRYYGRTGLATYRAALRRSSVLAYTLHKEGCFRLAVGIIVPSIPAGLAQPRCSWFRRYRGHYYTGEISEPSIVPGHVVETFSRKNGLHGFYAARSF